MATFNYTGLAELGLSFQEIMDIPDNIAFGMLDAASEVVVAAQKKSLRSLGLVDTGKLADSIQVYQRNDRTRNPNDPRRVLIHPDGNRRTYLSRVKVRKYARSKHGRTYTVGGKRVTTTNSEIGFIHEFGAPKKGIPASQWMSKANEACAEATVAAEFAVYDAWLKSKNL